MGILTANIGDGTTLIADMGSSDPDLLFLDGIYKLSISDPPDFDGQWGFDILADLDSFPNSIQTDLYVGLGGSWNLLKEMTFTADDLTVAAPVNLTRTVESDDNIGLAWTAQRTTGFLDRIYSKEFVAKYDEVRIKIAARTGDELILSDYATLQAAIEALNAGGSGGQLNIDQDITANPPDSPPDITVSDIVIYSDNQSVITIGNNGAAMTSPFYFTGNDVHIMGVSVDIDRDNQINSISGTLHNGCDGFSIIGCDIRNSNHHNFATSGSSNGVYGCCLALVSGDDCFTANSVSDNIIMEFCMGGCSNFLLGGSRAFEFENGDTYCTLYKNIAFGQIEWGAFDTHIDPGDASCENILMEECFSVYNSKAVTWSGQNIIGNTIENSILKNCRDVSTFYQSCRLRNIKDCTVIENQFLAELYSTRPEIHLSGAISNVDVWDNKIGKINLQFGEFSSLLRNEIAPAAGDIGIYMTESDNNDVNQNVFDTEETTAWAIYLTNSDDNILNSNEIVSPLAIGIYFAGTSDGNTGTDNDLEAAVIEVRDDSSGVNTIT